MRYILRSCCLFPMIAIFSSSTPIDENALSPRSTTPESLALYETIANLTSNFSLSASSNAPDLLDSFNAGALGEFGEPIPIGFEIRLLPVDRDRRISLHSFYDLMMQALSQFAMYDYESQAYPSFFQNPSEAPWNKYAMTVYGLSQSSPQILSTIQTRFALWGLLRVLERISGLGQWTEVKAQFYMHDKILGGMHFGYRQDFPELGINTDSRVGGTNMPVGSSANVLVLASDPSIISGSSSSSKKLTSNAPTASNATLWLPLANVTSSSWSSSSSLAGKYGRVELVPHYGPNPLNPHQIMVSYARALAIGGLAIPPKSNRPPPSIRFDQQDLQTSVYFDKAAPMAALPVWTYEWIITAIGHVVNETWAVPDRGLYSCVYDVKVDKILLGYVGIGRLR